MATTVVKTIGTGGDYTTIQSWEDACPASLVAVDQIWQGKLKNQEFTSATTLLTVAGTTVDSTRYVELTSDTGASFTDNASASTNPLRYDATKGAAVRITNGYAVAIIVQQSYTRINKLQISSSASGAGASAALQINTAEVANCDIDKCIFEGYALGGSLGIIKLSGANRVRNSLIAQKNTGAGTIIAAISDGASAVNCTFVSLGATLTNGLYSTYAASNLENCYVGNVVSPTTGTFTKTNCYSNATATGFSVAPFSTATFENVTAGTHDLRLKTGSGLIDVGVTDATYAANDILGTARVAGTYDVGAHELAAVSAPAATLSWTEGSEVVAATGNVAVAAVTVAAGWAESSETDAISATFTPPNGVITTPVLKNNMGSTHVNETGVVVNVYNPMTGALVVRKTGLTSSAEGTVTITDALIIPGTSYAYEVVLATNGRGLLVVAAA